MERYARTHPGTFTFSRLVYGDSSWVPTSLDYGVLKIDGELWTRALPELARRDAGVEDRLDGRCRRWCLVTAGSIATIALLALPQAGAFVGVQGEAFGQAVDARPQPS